MMYNSYEEKTKVIPLDKSSVDVQNDRMTFTVNKVDTKEVKNLLKA